MIFIRSACGGTGGQREGPGLGWLSDNIVAPRRWQHATRIYYKSGLVAPPKYPRPSPYALSSPPILRPSLRSIVRIKQHFWCQTWSEYPSSIFYFSSPIRVNRLLLVRVFFLFLFFFFTNIFERVPNPIERRKWSKRKLRASTFLRHSKYISRYLL